MPVGETGNKIDDVAQHQILLFGCCLMARCFGGEFYQV